MRTATNHSRAFGGRRMIADLVYKLYLSKLTHSHKIFRNDFVCIHYHICKIFSQIRVHNFCSLGFPTINSRQQFTVRWGNSLSMTFRCANMIMQRGQLSPLLYNVYADNLNHHLQPTGVGC